MLVALSNRSFEPGRSTAALGGPVHAPMGCLIRHLLRKPQARTKSCCLIRLLRVALRRRYVAQGAGCRKAKQPKQNNILTLPRSTWAPICCASQHCVLQCNLGKSMLHCSTAAGRAEDGNCDDADSWQSNSRTRFPAYVHRKGNEG